MKIEQFMNENPNWREILAAEPYCIKVKEDSGYVLLEYNQLSSDMSNSIVQQCRGSIFYYDGSWKCVCRPFRKFFNVQQEEAAKIDWGTAKVQEKIDGSIMKVWYHNGWHLSTNGTINAFNATCNNTISFGELFERAAGCKLPIFTQNFDIDYTYIFELTTPESRLIIEYPDGVWCLAKKHTQYEYERPFLKEDFPWVVKIKFPMLYPLNTLNECLSCVEVMTKNQEGFVVVDANGNRIKIKSPEWCIAHAMFDNGHFSVKNTIGMIQNQMIDDYIAYVPQYKPYVEEVQEFIKKCIDDCAKTLEAYTSFLGDRKALAANIKGEPWADYVFSYITFGITPEEYVLKRMKACNLWDIWKREKKI